MPPLMPPPPPSPLLLLLAGAVVFCGLYSPEMKGTDLPSAMKSARRSFTSSQLVMHPPGGTTEE